ncbi:MAG: M17 family peptidase N-terminal domain-containing protein [Candidatus Methylomirabilales bacterium]
MTPSSPDSLQEVTGDTLVLFHFEDIPVPRNSLGTVDWYLSGAVSRLAVDGKFTGALGSAVLFHPAGKFRVEKILVLGLGPRAAVDAHTLQAAARHLRGLLDNLHARDIRIVLPDPLPVPPHEAMELFSTTFPFSKEQRADSPRIRFLTSQGDKTP